MAREYSLDRRAYLTTVGAAGVTALAGCTDGQQGNGDGDGNGTDDGGDGEMTMVPGTSAGFPPFEFRKGGELVGFDVDLLNAVVSETGYTLGDWKDLEFGSLIQALNSGQIDVIAAGMTINAERKEKVAFSEPYYDANQAIVVRSDGDFRPESLDDLSGHPLGAQSGTTGEQVIEDELIAKDRLEESNYRSYDEYILAIEDLQNGNIDAVVVDVPVAETFAEQRPVEVAFVHETGEKYGFAVRQDDDARLEALNGGLATVRENGTYEELRNEWFGGSD